MGPRTVKRSPHFLGAVRGDAGAQGQARKEADDVVEHTLPIPVFRADQAFRRTAAKRPSDLLLKGQSEKPLCIIASDLTARAVRNGVEGVIAPRQIERRHAVAVPPQRVAHVVLQR